MTLSIDLETYSSVDISKSGLYKYVQSADFEILLFGYAFDDENVQIIDLAQGELLPPLLLQALFDSAVLKTAYNAPFEWCCLSKYLSVNPALDWLLQWQCTMHHALYCGYPAGLKAVASAMGFDQDKQKMTCGKALIRKFCIPCKPTKTNGNRLRNYPHHEPEQWEIFKEYCKQDVVVEREIFRRLSCYQIPSRERYLWRIDQSINLMGVKVDLDLIEGAVLVHKQVAEELTSEAIRLTGLDNPNSVKQLKEWLEKETGNEITSLAKGTISELINSSNSISTTRVLQLRLELSKTSIKKYHAMQAAVCGDGRVRGLLQFYGANRTGRWAGRFVQVQNLPRNYLSTLDAARKFTKDANVPALKLLYGNVPDTISQLIRTAFVPREGCIFHVADFSAIEARVIAWLANEQWRLEVFNTHGRIYEASASAMFGVPIEKISKGNPEYALRQKGKVAELALGYQGSAGALIKMGALEKGLTEEELPGIVSRWRQANKRIVDFWHAVENAAVTCVQYGISQALPRGVLFSRDTENLIITLPSGRQLFYVHPIIAPNQWGSPQVYYYGIGDDHKWELTPTYGGKLTENIVQAVARDCLAECLINLYEAGYETVMHIHDECVLEVPINDTIKSLENAIEIMCRPVSWASGLPLNADGFSGMYYKKE